MSCAPDAVLKLSDTLGLSEYRNADEQVDEAIRCNGYEFDEDGSIA